MGTTMMRAGRDVTVTAWLLAAAVGIAACSGQPPFDTPPVPVKVQAVEPVLPETGLRFSASLAPREQVDLAFKVGGYVQNMLRLAGPDGIMRDVQKGDPVTKSTVLAELRDSDYQAKLDQARSVLEESKASLAQAIREFERAERLLQEGALAKNEYDKAKERLDVTRARVAGAQSQVQEAELHVQDCVLQSPLAGVLVSRWVERGTLVGPGTRAFVLADLSSVKAVFGVPDYVLRQVTPGDSLAVAVDAFQNRQFRGAVTAVSPSADPKSRVFEVEITNPNPQIQLKDGMIATVHVGGGLGGEPVPAVPLNAVVRPPGDAHSFMVFIVDQRDGNPVARGRKVEIGKVFANRVAIASGLAVGDRIITKGSTLVSDGAAVKIIP